MESRNEAVEIDIMVPNDNIQNQNKESEMSQMEDFKQTRPMTNGAPDEGEQNQGGNNSATPKKRLSQVQKIGMLRNLAIQHYTEEQICEHMKITKVQFALLFFQLTQKDGRNYEITPTPQTVTTWVRDSGIGLTKDQLEQLDTHGLFKVGNRAIFSTMDDGSIKITSKEPNDKERQKWNASQARREAKKASENKDQDAIENEPFNPESGECNIQASVTELPDTTPHNVISPANAN